MFKWKSGESLRLNQAN